MGNHLNQRLLARSKKKKNAGDTKHSKGFFQIEGGEKTYDDIQIHGETSRLSVDVMSDRIRGPKVGIGREYANLKRTLFSRKGMKVKWRKAYEDSKSN